MFLLVLGVVQFALFEHTTHIAEAAAEQNLTVSHVEGGSAADGNAAAQNLLVQVGNAVLSGVAVNTTRGDATTSVTVTGHAEAVLPWLTLPVRVEMNGPTNGSSRRQRTAMAGVRRDRGVLAAVRARALASGAGHNG